MRSGGGGLQAEHQRGREAAGVGAMEHAAGIRTGGQQPANRLSVGAEHARALVDPQAGEGEGDRGDDLDHVVRGRHERRGVEPASGLELARLALAVVLEQRVARGFAVVAPFLGQVGELLDVLGDRRPRAALVRELELVDRLDAFDVGREHPLLVHALVGDQQRPRVGLIEHVQRAQVIADRLVAEALTAAVEQHPVLGVVEGQVRELVRVRVDDPGRDQVAVEAGVGRARGRTRGLGEAQAVAGAVEVRAQRDVPRRGRDVLGAQVGIAAEAAGGEQRAARANGARAGGRLDLGADDGTVLREQPERVAAHQHLAALAHEAVAGEQEVRHVGGAPAPVAEHGDRLGDVHAERADERERVVIALDDPASKRRVAVRIDLAHDLGGRRGPDETGVRGRAADRLALLHEHDARAL